MLDPAHIDLAILGARPKAVAALLRYFRDLDTAEEAFQEACLRALQTWPQKGIPRDPTAWLVMVGRNAALDSRSRDRANGPLPDADTLADARDDLAPERLDESHYRDDILRLLFVCGHPALPATQQIALALRIVCGLTVEQIAKAFLVTPVAMEQPLPTPGGHCRAPCQCRATRGHVVESDRLAIPVTRSTAALTGGDAQSSRGSVEATRSRGRA